MLETLAGSFYQSNLSQSLSFSSIFIGTIDHRYGCPLGEFYRKAIESLLLWFHVSYPSLDSGNPSCQTVSHGNFLTLSLRPPECQHSGTQPSRTFQVKAPNDALAPHSYHSSTVTNLQWGKQSILVFHHWLYNMLSLLFMPPLLHLKPTPWLWGLSLMNTAHIIAMLTKALGT